MIKKGIVERIERQEKDNQLIVQLAEIEIDSTQLESYLELLHEGIRTSIKEELGVLKLYAMADKDKPNRITVAEIYENQKAYESHIKSSHFLKYKNGTNNMYSFQCFVNSYSTQPILSNSAIFMFLR